MVFAHGFSACYACRRPFVYNPIHVPSIRIDGVRQPVCRECVERANPRRLANGLNPIVILPDAYDACDEAELIYLDDDEPA